MFHKKQEGLILLLALALLLVLPALFEAFDNGFLVSTASRILIFAIAAISLDLLIGYTGLVSFGHAAYLGVGAYVVGILSHHAYEETTFLGLAGTLQGLIALPLAVVTSALFALVIGMLALRTKGVYFIMITLSFGQMLFFLFVSLEQYGGDDGLMMFDGRNEIPGLNLNNDVSFYYLCLTLLALYFLFCRRLVASKFGRLISSVRQNEPRLIAVGVAPYSLKLAAFVVAGAGAGLAGALLANHTEFVSPALTHWTKSGEIMIMVILGGIGTLIGPVLGVIAFLLMEEFLPSLFGAMGLDLLKEHWRIVFGPILIVVVLYARNGLYGLLFRRG